MTHELPRDYMPVEAGEQRALLLALAVPLRFSVEALNAVRGRGLGGAQGAATVELLTEYGQLRQFGTWMQMRESLRLEVLEKAASADLASAVATWLAVSGREPNVPEDMHLSVLAGETSIDVVAGNVRAALDAECRLEWWTNVLADFANFAVFREELDRDYSPLLAVALARCSREAESQRYLATALRRFYEDSHATPDTPRALLKASNAAACASRKETAESSADAVDRPSKGDMLRDAIRVSEEQTRWNDLCEAKHAYGIHLSRFSVNQPRAHEVLASAEQLARTHHLNRLLAPILATRARVIARSSHDEDGSHVAEQLLAESIRVAVQEGMHAHVAVALGRLGGLYFEAERPSDGDLCMAASLDLSRTTGDLSMASRSASRWADYVATIDAGRGLSLRRTAVDLAEATGDAGVQASAYLGLVRFLVEQGLGSDSEILMVAELAEDRAGVAQTDWKGKADLDALLSRRARATLARARELARTDGEPEAEVACREALQMAEHASDRRLQARILAAYARLLQRWPHRAAEARRAAESARDAAAAVARPQPTIRMPVSDGASSPSTGSVALDYALVGGGFPRGSIVTVSGPDAAANSCLVDQLIGEASRRGQTAALVVARDSPGVSRPEVAIPDVSYLRVSCTATLDEAVAALSQLVSADAFDVVAVASSVASSQAQVDSLRRALARISAPAGSERPVVVLTADLDFDSGVFRSSVRRPSNQWFLRLIPIGPIRAHGKVVGRRVMVNVTCSRPLRNFAVTYIDIIRGKGLSHEGALLDVGSALGVIRKRGAYYDFRGQSLGCGRAAASEFLVVNPEIAREIEAAIGQVSRRPSGFRHPANLSQSRESVHDTPAENRPSATRKSDKTHQ